MGCTEAEPTPIFAQPHPPRRTGPLMRGSVRRAGWARGHPALTPYRHGGHPGRKGLAGSHQGRGASPGMRAEKGAITKLGPQGLGVHSIKSNFHSLVSAMSSFYSWSNPSSSERPIFSQLNFFVIIAHELAGSSRSYLYLTRTKRSPLAIPMITMLELSIIFVVTTSSHPLLIRLVQ